jgi:aconitase A
VHSLKNNDYDPEFQVIESTNFCATAKSPKSTAKAMRPDTGIIHQISEN